MCKLSNLYVVDLFNNTAIGGIEWNVVNSLPQLMNNKCKIVVKQVVSQTKSSSSVDITLNNYVRIIHNMNINSGCNNFNGNSNSNTLCFLDSFAVRTIHNMNINSGCNNFNGNSNSNTLCFLDSFAVRTINANFITATTSTNLTLYAPNGLPAVLTLNRVWDLSTIIDDATLSWNVRLEITVNPDEE